MDHFNCKCVTEPIEEKMSKDKECACPKCVNACHVSPGWFAPGEAEKVAEYFGMSFPAFAEKFLTKDSADNWNVGDAPYIYTPRKVWLGEVETGEHRTKAQQVKHGKCVFLENERCRIHAVKPFECRKVMACDQRTWGSFTGENNRDLLEKKWIKAGAPLGMRPEPVDERWDDDDE